jgi:hypothetical protein
MLFGLLILNVHLVILKVFVVIGIGIRIKKLFLCSVIDLSHGCAAVIFKLNQPFINIICL